MIKFSENEAVDTILKCTPFGALVLLADCLNEINKNLSETPTEKEENEMNLTEAQLLEELLDEVDVNTLLTKIRDISDANDRSLEDSYFNIEKTVINANKVLFITSGPETRSIVLGEE